MATTHGEAISANGVQGAEGMRPHEMWKSHSPWRHVNTQLAAERGRRRGEGEALKRVWGWRTCDLCGETVVLGQEMVGLSVGMSPKDVCPGRAGAWGQTAQARGGDALV
jgi:hypothetical protein